MKIHLLFLVCLALLTAPAVWANPDYQDFIQDITDFLAVMDQLHQQIPKVEDANGAAKIIETWANANDAFSAAGREFSQKYPDVIKQKYPPSELAGALEQLDELKTIYADVPVGVRKLIRDFGNDPIVAADLELFKSSLQQLDEVKR